MATALNQFEMGELVQEQERNARLEERTAHMQPDITEIKADIRRIDGKLNGLIDVVDGLRLEMAERFAAVDRTFAALELRFDAKFAALEAKFDKKFAELE